MGRELRPNCRVREALLWSKISLSAGALCAAILQERRSPFCSHDSSSFGGVRMADDNPRRPDSGPGEPVPDETAPTSGFTRRGFLKGAGVAVSVPVLIGEGFLEAAAPEARVAGPGPVPI